jgi:hypothetical protein
MSIPEPKLETPPAEAPLCERCQEPLATNEAGERHCPHCAERGQLLWIVGIALLFFCFVFLPMMIQLLGTPPPGR